MGKPMGRYVYQLHSSIRHASRHCSLYGGTACIQYQTSLAVSYGILGQADYIAGEKERVSGVSGKDLPAWSHKL